MKWQLLTALCLGTLAAAQTYADHGITYYANGGTHLEVRPSDSPFLKFKNSDIYFGYGGTFYGRSNGNTFFSYGPSNLNCHSYDCVLVFQTDGNLVIYGNGVAYWNTDSFDHGDGKGPGIYTFITDTTPYVSVMAQGNQRLFPKTTVSGGPGGGGGGGGGGDPPCSQVRCCTENGCTNPPRMKRLLDRMEKWGIM